MTIRVSDVELEKTKAVLSITFDGKAHDDDDTTNANASLLTFTRPTAVILIVCGTPCNTEMTLGDNDVTDTMDRRPDSK